MITIAVSNNKGGAGKTTTAGSLAAALATMGHRVLMGDLDSQASLSSWSGVGKNSPRHVGQLLLAPVQEAAAWPTLPVAPNLELLPGHQLLGESLAKLAKLKDAQPAYRLRDRLAQLAPRFDLVLLDCPPGDIDGMTLAAFCAAQVYVVATDPEPFSVEGLAMLMQRATGVQTHLNRQLRFAGFVVPKFNPAIRGALRQQMLADMTQHFGQESLLGTVPQDAKIIECQGLRQTIFAYAPESRAAKSYLTIASTLLTRL